MNLEKQKILSLDLALKSEIEKSLLYKGCRDNAFVQAAAFVEEVDRSLKYPIFGLENYEASDSVTTADILSFAVWIAWKKCAQCNCKHSHLPDLTKRDEYIENLTDTAKYAYIFDHLLMGLAGHAVVELDADENIRFHLEKSNKQMQVLDYHSRHLNWDIPAPTKIVAGIAEICAGQVTGIYRRRLSYKRNFETVKRIMDFLKPLFDQLHFFGDIAIPTAYKLSDFREIWLCLVSLVLLNGRLTKGFQISHPAQFVVSADLNYSKKYWIKLLSRLTMVRSDRIAAILGDLTYNGDQHTRPDKAPLPPFLPVRNSLLLLNRVLITAMGEQDLYRLFNLSKKNVHTEMKKHKEQLQLDRIRTIFSGSDVNVYGPFSKVVFNGEKTDLDAIIFSRKQRVAWCCQLKSPAPARWRKDYQRIADDIQSAYHQVDVSLAWLSTAPQAVLKALNVSQKEYAQLDFRGIVVSSKALGAGLTKTRKEIPLTTEYILYLLVKAHGRADLDQLWMNAKSAAVLPIEGIDFRLCPAICNFKGVKYITENGLAVPTWWHRLTTRYPSLLESASDEFVGNSTKGTKKLDE